METKAVALVVILTGMLTACAWGDHFERAERAERLPSHPWVPDLPRVQGHLKWEDFRKPDLVPINMRVCRSPEGTYMRWDVLITLQNQGGNLSLNTSEAPVDIYVDFDGNRPYGINNETGEPLTLEEYDETLLRDMPDQQWMSVPRAGNFGGAAFSLWYPEGGSGSRYRRIPTNLTVMLDQYRGNNPTGGIVEESNEENNIVAVHIDRYDEINGRTGTYAIRCWYSQ